jgi:hypothetical protein
MAALTFPASPTPGQIFEASNGAVYEWMAAGFWRAATSGAQAFAPAVIKAPDTATRNRVQPTAAGFPGLLLAPSGPGQSEDLLAALDSGGTRRFALGPDGAPRRGGRSVTVPAATAAIEFDLADCEFAILRWADLGLTSGSNAQLKLRLGFGAAPETTGYAGTYFYRYASTRSQAPMTDCVIVGNLESSNTGSSGFAQIVRFGGDGRRVTVVGNSGHYSVLNAAVSHYDFIGWHTQTVASVTKIQLTPASSTFARGLVHLQEM